MLHHKSLAREVCRRIRRYPNFKEASEMASGLSAKNYLVGGKVYRTILEIELGKDLSPESADWDFLMFDSSLQEREFAGWIQRRGPGTKKENRKSGGSGRGRPPSVPHPSSAIITITSGAGGSTSGNSGSGGTPSGITITVPQQVPIATGWFTGILVPPQEQTTKEKYVENQISRTYDSENGKVDLVAIEDIQKLYPKHGKVNLSLYLRAVPLDIQSIALDMHDETLYGLGLDAIRNGRISVNNPVSVLIEGDINEYLRNKGNQLNMPVVEWIIRTECACDSKTLFNHGCKCGFLKGLRNGGPL